MTLRPLHLLVDADGTWMDWGTGFTNLANLNYSHMPNIPRHNEQRSFNLKLGLSVEEAAAVDEMFLHPHFYRDLQPYPGAVETYHKMIEAGHYVQIATSPWWANPTCLQDKSDSIAKHFGEDARRTLILSSDKTAERGDYLFDDKPDITGFYPVPTWQQILVDQPYNQNIELPRIFGWETNEWEEVIEELELLKTISFVGSRVG